jgi:hypothetical protein
MTVAGHYTPDGRVRRFITKVALPKTGRRRRTSASSADGADLTREKAVEYPYSQVSLGFFSFLFFSFSTEMNNKLV